MKNMKVGFIGCGNMGGALASAVCNNSEIKVYICDTDNEKVQKFASKHSIYISDANSIAESCDFIFLAVKPAGIDRLLSSLKDAFLKNPRSVIVSMAAGVSLSRLSGALGASHPIIRIMPNTPVAVGEGVITWCKNELVSVADAESFKFIMKDAGIIDEIDEQLIDAASAVAGCGPAFAYMFIEALADGAVFCGLPRDKAISYACNMLRGSASMVLKTGKHPELLKDEVCSPGGSTIEGVGALEAGSFRATVGAAVTASYNKTKKL